jgi:hypothetical protein
MKSNVIKELNSLSLNHKITLSMDDYREFINGLHQAEGTMGAYFPKN